MKITIDEQALAEEDMELCDFLIAFVIRAGRDPNTVMTKMLNKHSLVVFQNQIAINPEYFKKMDKVLVNSDKELTKQNSLEEIIDAMTGIYPKGLKPGTMRYWRGNRTDNLDRLRKLILTHKSDKSMEFTKENVLKATQLYVDRYLMDNTTMRILPYFIMKDGESELATILSNMDQENEEDQMLGRIVL